MAMLRSAGPMPLTRRPAIRMSPAVAVSRPAIMRKVVVLPQPDGPSRQRTSPAPTSRSTASTARRPPPNTLLTFLRLIVDMARPSALDRAEGDAAQQMVLQEEHEDDDRHQEQGFDRGQEAPTHADVAADGLHHRDRD